MVFLVIDDDDLSRELLTLLLGVEGLETLAAHSGEEALSQLDTSGYRADAVLMDLQMPGISGRALAAALRLALQPGTPILAMSASQTKTLAQIAVEGFDGFLMKPFTMGQLRTVIENASPKFRDELVHKAEVEPARAESSVEGSTPALNEEIFGNLRALMPTTQLGQMYALCIGDARSRMESMHVLAAAGDDVAYRAAAHAIKGGAGMIGASEMYSLLEIAEHEGISVQRTDDIGTTRDSVARTDRATELLNRLALSCDRLERILEERLSN